MKKGTKWVIHKQWTNKMKKAECAHFYLPKQLTQTASVS